MDPYLNLVKEVLTHGDLQENRTGVPTLNLPGAMLRFDLQQGFPAVTTKKLAFKSVIGELVGFLRGICNADEFARLGSKVWLQNANENEAWLANPFRVEASGLGPVYGFQWRGWPAYKAIDLNTPQGPAQVAAALNQGYRHLGVTEDVQDDGKTTQVILYKSIDQLRLCLDTLISDPDSRRILFHGWNWAQLDEMALPPCHLLYQFLANKEKRELSLCLYLRSSDLGLGLPFNASSSAALLHLVARLTGFTPKFLTIFIGSAHIYVNHKEMLETQLSRDPYPLPHLALSDRIPDFAKTGKYAPEWLNLVEPEDFQLVGYQHHPAITAPMAV